MDPIARRQVLAALSGVGVAGLAGCLGSLGGEGNDTTTDQADATTDGVSETEDGGGGDSAPAWLTAELTDVQTGETFTVESLPKPVLLETFAVWCSTCLKQQTEIRAFHEEVGDAVTSVTLNVDPNEDAEKVRQHLDRHGFDWRYAISPSAVTNSLVDQFGSTMTVPPRAPVVVVCEDDATRLPDGVKSADELSTAVDEC
jgi:cytochrome oxidase Cu insertion factor (SCO1/SenC/PrrC family)